MDAQSLLHEAERLVRSSSRLTSLMFNLVLPPAGRTRSIFCYAYLRMLDNHVDEDGVSPEFCFELLSRHRAFVKRLFDDRPPGYAGALPEDFLVEAARLDPSGALREPVLQMLSSMTSDYRNMAGYPTWAEQADSAALEAHGYLRVLYICCEKGDETGEPDLGAPAGAAAKIAHNLRDLRADLEQGRNTVPLDEIASGGMTPALDPPEALLRWARRKKRLARSLFSEGKAELAAKGAGLRYLICFAMLCAKYEAYLDSPVSWLVNRRRTGVAVIWALLFPVRLLATLITVSRRET